MTRFDMQRTGQRTGQRSGVFDWVFSFGLAVAFVFALKTAAFATYYIPSESMVPTLQVGDRVTTSKFAYGWGRYSLAFGLELPESVSGRLLSGEPKRGDVVVFMHPRRGERMIKRLVGLPGDTIRIRDGRVILNGKVVPRRLDRRYSYREHGGGIVEVSEYTETLPNGVSHKVLHRGSRFGRSRYFDMDEVTVPAGHYFMMGDNRENSADSRFSEMGFVPADYLIGRGEVILYSLYSCNDEPGTECARPRFATRLQ